MPSRHEIATTIVEALIRKEYYWRIRNPGKKSPFLNEIKLSDREAKAVLKWISQTEHLLTAAHIEDSETYVRSTILNNWAEEPIESLATEADHLYKASICFRAKVFQNTLKSADTAIKQTINSLVNQTIKQGLTDIPQYIALSRQLPDEKFREIVRQLLHLKSESATQ